VPKTLIFAKDDSHAEDIVKIVREEFAKGNEFAQKITYRTTGEKPENLIKSFRNSYFPRIAVTVDMIATGTDIKPLEVVLFMRAVKSRTFFEQMKGRGVRVIKPDDLRSVTPDAAAKERFVIVDAVGVCEQDMTDSRPMDQKKSVPFEKLLQAVALGNKEPEVISSIAVRLARLNKRLSTDEHKLIEKLAGMPLHDLTTDLVNALNPDRHVEQAKRRVPTGAEPTEAQLRESARSLIEEAVKPLHNPDLRNLLDRLRAENEQTIDTVSQDRVLEAGFSQDALDRASTLVQSFEQFIKDNKDEITALQIIYNKPYKARLKFDDVKDLADRIQSPPRLWTESQLWQAYAALEKSKVKGASTRRILTDLVSLVRFAVHQDNELVPFPERVNANFNVWLGQQEVKKRFSGEQLHWLKMIRDHVAANLVIEKDDFELAPFNQEGGLGKVYKIFGSELDVLIEDLNGVLAA
jgi:type I restriction enzyme R subunit